MPTHIIEHSCFLKSNVGMSNVLVTDAESAGCGQRDNHASGTKFTWASTCEGGVAESNGDDCLETGNCDGICAVLSDAIWGDFHPFMCTNTILPTGDVSTHKSRIGQVSARSIYNKLVKANKLVGNKHRKKNDVCTAVGQ